MSRGLLAAALFMLLAAMSAGEAYAERVHVRAASGEIGHAWLFGSEWSGEVACWLALPRHVAQSIDRKSLEPFAFIDSAGRSGQSAMPIWIGDVDGAVEAAGGAEDLAFARVFAGPTSCLSRLGPPAHAYPSMLDRIDSVDVWSMSEGSYGQFKLIPTRVQTTEGGGGIRFKPFPGDESYLAQGLSGAVAMTQHAGAEVPFAMITEVNAGATEARALRFDRIRGAFDKVQAYAKSNAQLEQIAADGVPYEFTEIATISTSGGPLSLGAPGECWAMATSGGKSTIDLVITIGEEVPLKGITISTGECSDGTIPYIVEQKTPAASSWSPVSDCTTTLTTEAAPDCLFDLKAPRQLRLRLIGVRRASVSNIRLY